MAVDLTPGAISMLLTGNQTVMEPVVQVIDIKCIRSQTQIKGNRVEKKESYNIILSDGSVCKGVIINYKINEMIRSNKFKKGSIVQLTKFSSYTDTLGSYIAVGDLNVIRCNSIILGDPKPFSGNKTPSVNISIPPKVKEEPVEPDVNKFIPPKVKEEPVVDPDVNEFIPLKVEEQPVDPDVNEFIPLKVEKEPVDPDVNEFIPLKVEEEPVDHDVNESIPLKVEEEPVDPDVNDDRHHADEPTAPKQKCSSCSQTQSRKRQRQSSDNKEDGDIGACFEKLEKLGWEEGLMYDTAVLLFGESPDYRKIWLHLKPNSCVNWVKNAGGKYGVLG